MSFTRFGAPRAAKTTSFTRLGAQNGPEIAFRGRFGNGFRPAFGEPKKGSGGPRAQNGPEIAFWGRFGSGFRAASGGPFFGTAGHGRKFDSPLLYKITNDFATFR